MAIKPDRWIREMAEKYGMIDPFSPSQVAEGKISSGLSSYRYDLRLADEFKLFAPPRDAVLNPKAIPPEFYRDHRGSHFDVPPNGYVLGRTVEYLRIPRDVLTLCVGKSTYARTGIMVNVTHKVKTSRGMRRYSTDRKSTRLNSSHSQISYAVFCLKKNTNA